VNQLEALLEHCVRAVNRTVVITGGSSGIGAAAARELRRRGVNVAITGRSAETARLAEEIGCDHFIADFARLDDVRTLAQRLIATYPRIDVLANNAGAVFATRQVTVDGHEKTFQVNYLAPFLLTWLLRDKLSDSKGAVINTASGAHHLGRLDVDDLENERHYSAWRAYGTAKLMNILHATEINRRMRNVRGVSFHPGVVATGFAREGSVVTRLAYRKFIAKLFMLPPEKGADTLVWLGTASDWLPGEYYVKRKPAKKSGAARDGRLARRLWDASARMLAFCD
jgi:NAD(P)-dependent dehydrogenase (short-subunit alcohol dehydrogenase family)